MEHCTDRKAQLPDALRALRLIPTLADGEAIDAETLANVLGVEIDQAPSALNCRFKRESDDCIGVDIAEGVYN